MKKLICCFYILGAGLLFTLPAMAQHTQKENDPFENDPLFTRPLSDFFKSGKDSTNHADSTRSITVRVRRLNDEGLDYTDTFEAGPYNSNPLYSIYPSLPLIHFNRIDALFLGLRKERMQWRKHPQFLGIPGIEAHWLVGYSFGLKDFQYTAGLEKYIGLKKHVILGGEYHSATTTDDYWRTGLNENSITSFFGGYDYLDYYKQQGWGAYLLFRTDRLFEGGIAFSDDRYNSLQQQTDFALFGSDNRYRPNPPVEFSNGTRVDTLDISSFTLSASFNPKQLLLSHLFTLSVNGTAGFADPGIGTSDYSYSQYLAQVKAAVKVERGGVFKYRLRAGSITGDAPSVKEFQLGGIGSLRALPYKSLPGNRLGDNQMLLSNAELQFGVPKLAADGWIDYDDFYFSLFLDSGWTNYSQKLQDGNNPFNGFSDFKFVDLQHNGGFGLGSNLIRAEVAWDLRHTSRKPVFWIRFNPTF